MFRLLFAPFRARVVWVLVGVLTVAEVAFVLTVALAASVVIAVQGRDADPDSLAAFATPLGMLAATATVGAMAATWRAMHRMQARRWVPMYQAMVRDTATVPDTYLAEILTQPDHAAAGHVMAADPRTGRQAPLWLPGSSLPRGTVVCFTQTSAGPQVRAWMSRRLWRACAREATRAEQRCARVEHERHEVREESNREAAGEMVAAAEQMLRQQDRS